MSGVLQFFHFRKNRGRGSTRFKRGKKHTRHILLPTRRGRLEDAAVRRFVTASDSQSQVTFGLTRGGRQPVGSVELKRLFRPNTIVEIK
jgi:hypothetical protein